MTVLGLKLILEDMLFLGLLVSAPDELMLDEHARLVDVERVSFGVKFNGTVEYVAWLVSVKKITFRQGSLV